jgi:hypothetical protein
MLALEEQLNLYRLAVSSATQTVALALGIGLPYSMPMVGTVFMLT